jgi:hypothetical protein
MITHAENKPTNGTAIQETALRQRHQYNQILVAFLKLISPGIGLNEPIIAKDL